MKNRIDLEKYNIRTDMKACNIRLYENETRSYKHVGRVSLYLKVW